MIDAPAIVRPRRATVGAWLVTRRLLPALVFVYVLLTMIWASVVPIGEGPDEPGHLHYALHLQAHGRLPVQSDDPVTSDVPGEGHQPPLAYLLMQPAVFWLGGRVDDVVLYGNPDFRWRGGADINAYFHGVSERPPYRGLMLAWHLARLVSVALGACSLLFCWATVRRIWPEDPGLALGATALVAWNPQWIFQHALVSNDPLLICLASALIYLAVVAVTSNPARQAQSPSEQWRWLPLWCGVVLGLMLITKQSALALVPVPLLALFLGRRNLSHWLTQSALVLVVTIAVAGWWYLRNWRLYGDPLGLQVFHLTFASDDFVLSQWQSWRDGFWNLLRSSVGMFGWMTLPLPDGLYVFARAALVVALAGLIAVVPTPVWQGRGAGLAILGLAIMLVLAWTIMFAVTAGAVAWQGRFLFPAMPALAAFLAVGLAYALPRRSGLFAVVGLWLVLAMALPWTVIRPVYASPARTADQVPRGDLYVRFDLGWKRGIELHDATFERVAPAGGELPIRLTWHLVEPVDRAWTVFIHLVDADGTIVAKEDAEPFAGQHPTSAWVPGDWYRDEQLLRLVDTPPGRYQLRLGFFDPVTTQRLGVFGTEGVLTGDYVVLGDITVTAAR